MRSVNLFRWYRMLRLTCVLYLSLFNIGPVKCITYLSLLKIVAQIKHSNPSTRGQFHQHAYTQLLCTQIPKAQKAAWLDSLFCAFGICERKSFLYNVDEIGPKLPRIYSSQPCRQNCWKNELKTNIQLCPYSPLTKISWFFFMSISMYDPLLTSISLIMIISFANSVHFALLKYETNGMKMVFWQTKMRDKKCFTLPSHLDHSSFFLSHTWNQERVLLTQLQLAISYTRSRAHTKHRCYVIW